MFENIMGLFNAIKIILKIIALLFLLNLMGENFITIIINNINHVYY